jgi:hypothetical protein
VTTECAGCGKRCGVTWPAFYVPAGTRAAIAYELCDLCAEQLYFGNRRIKNRVMNLVELRIGPMEGNA